MSMTTTIKRIITLLLVLALSVNIVAGCMRSNGKLDDSSLTETLEYMTPDLEKEAGTVIDKATTTSNILEQNEPTPAVTPRPTTHATNTTAPTTKITETEPVAQTTTTVKLTETAKPTTKVTTAAPTPVPTTQKEGKAPTPADAVNYKPSYTKQEFIDEMFRLVNETRVEYGLNELERGPDIIWQGADLRARELAKRFSHLRPAPNDMQTSSYTYVELGCTGDYLYNNLGLENIAFNSDVTVDAAGFLAQFMASPGHRDTILSRKIGQSPKYGRSKSMTIGYYWGLREQVNSAYHASFVVLNIF